MKALGATNRRILMQFFLEGAFLTALSGGIGIAITAGVMAILAKLPTPPGFDLPHIVPASAAVAVGSLIDCGHYCGTLSGAQSLIVAACRSIEKGIARWSTIYWDRHTRPSSTIAGAPR